MTAPAPPALTVRHDGSERTFAAGHDVVVGRDLRADMRITHPLISRAHLLLRFDQGRWLAIDNGSLNGTFANGRKVPVVDIHDGQSINIGNPDGPQLSFEVGRHQGMAGRPPQTESMGIPVAAPAGWPSSQASGQPMPAGPPKAHPGERRPGTHRRRRGRPVNRRGHPGSRCTRRRRAAGRPSTPPAHRRLSSRTPAWDPRTRHHRPRCRPSRSSRQRSRTWRPRCSRRYCLLGPGPSRSQAAR